MATNFKKIYVHHYYTKSLFYKLAHNTINRTYNIKNEIGDVKCNYKNLELQFIFNPELNDNEDGFHLIDFLTILSQLKKDSKFNTIDCFNKQKGEDAHRGKWGAEFGVNDVPIMKWIADTLDSKKNWLICLFRTEKSFIKYDGIKYIPIQDLETQINRLKKHKLISDNCFINNVIEEKYPNHYFALTNTIHEWNDLLSIRWYYEFKNIFEKLNQPYDICFSMRYHKRNRTEIINGLSNLNNPKIYLSRVDNCINSEYSKYSKAIKNDNINFNITNGDNFDDISWIENVEHYLDYLMRILPMAKMHILSETWDWVPGNLTSNYLSEKTYGLVLSNIPFISTHTYPLDILEKTLGIEKHPFYEESKKCIKHPEKFVEFIKNFMKNFEINYNLCILWTNKCHKLLIEKINNENSLLNIVENDFYKKEKLIIKNLI
jgi:hypothetical protein